MLDHHKKFLLERVASLATGLAHKTQPPAEEGHLPRASNEEIATDWIALTAAVAELEPEFVNGDAQ